ncbi:MAG: Lrp/AsnC family transcriptional regulator, partial [Candidatus Hydrothermarchaeaceae archaeon]
MAEKANEKKVQNISPGMTEKKLLTLINLMRKGRISDSDLMKVLDLKSANAASYYRKHLEDQGIIKKYTVEIDWNKLGYPAEFIVLAEGEDMEASYDMEKEFLEALDEYRAK